MGVEINIPAVDSPAVSIPAIEIGAVDVEVAAIVAKQSFLNRTSSLTATTVYTPAASGLYRVSVYIETSSTAASAMVTVLYTDDYRFQQPTFAQSSSGQYQAGGAMSPVASIRATSGNPIQVSAGFSGTGHFDVYVVVEQLW